MRHRYTTLMMIWLILLLPIVQAQGLASLQGPDVAAPTISDVRVVAGDLSTISWTTNEPATSSLDYGESAQLGRNTNTTALVTNHSLAIPTEQRTYFYTIESCDSSDNCRKTALSQFSAGPLTITANVPRFARGRTIDISGQTRAGTDILLSVNNRTRTALTNTGDFTFRTVSLDEANNITLEASSGNESARASYFTEIDEGPPMMDIALPLVATQPASPMAQSRCR